ncbi:MAG: asparagine synthase (glutamine-hydrolyzing) [Candidatus Hydrogenedentes bacterium]|nr:asparagine synthase (glutamine-hydrolyzing) [Candidatus Hydrogenedentota bacterium]
MMCGIAAVSGPQSDGVIQDILARLGHRGPDGHGVTRIGDITLGHVRLAIMDVAGGKQPMFNERADLAIAFNGEIYNHLALRREIEVRHTFQTRSDTEVLLHLFEESAEDMLPKLDGMFAVALAGPGGLLLARDALGIKPLYYARKGKTLMAASEIRALPPLDRIHCLPAGHALLPDGREIPFAPHWPPHPHIAEAPLEEILPEIRRRLDTAVRKRMMSDVPVGVYLSGGLDSSLIAAAMRPHTVELHSFTAGMKGAPDLLSAREVARHLGTIHHEALYTEEDVERALPDIIRHLESFDAPLVRSAIPMYFVSALASKFVKVILSGEGADELFAGYEYLTQYESDKELRRELNKIVVRLQDTNLQRCDRMTMAHGIEGRVPFLDLDLVRYLARIPTGHLQTRTDRPEKWLLREACKGWLPQRFLMRKKMKFSEGAGSSTLLAHKAAKSISRREFEDMKHITPGITLRSPEEAYYYRLWREAMGPHVPPSLVGRTADPKAAAE